MDASNAAWVFARRAGWVGLACGVIYSFGGFVVDLVTIGLNWGTLLAFGALLGMPLAFAAVGFVLGSVVGWLRPGTHSA